MVVSHIGNNIYVLESGDTKPSNVSTGAIYITRDTRKIFVWDGDSWEEIAYGTGGGTDEKVVVKENGSAIGAGLGRNINFTVSTDFDITEDTGDDEYEIKIADNSITNNHINAHTSTKITITDRGKLPSEIGYEDESNTWQLGQLFQSSATFEAENLYSLQQKHTKQTSTPSDPTDLEDGITYLKEIDSNNNIFASKSKVGGGFMELRDF
jgi:hypothetical protein